MENYNINQISRTKLIKLIILVLFLIFLFLIYQKIGYQKQTITVIGTAELSTKPDNVTFIVTRINSGNDIALAIDDGINGINKLIKTVQEFAGPDVQIKKTFYQVTPQSNNYTIANAFSVTSNKTSEVNNWIKKIYAAGATSISNIVFESKDLKLVDQQLKSNAITNSKDKAVNLASSMSKKIGKIISINDETTSNSSTIEEVNQEEGLINLSKNLTVTYEIR